MTPQIGGGSEILFDNTTKTFASVFPIYLANRVTEKQFQDTLDKCNDVMKKYMHKISKTDKHEKSSQSVICLQTLVFFSLTLALAFINEPITKTGILLYVYMGLNWIAVLVCEFIGSTRNLTKVNNIHTKCKRTLEGLLEKENQNYWKYGAQLILKYNIPTKVAELFYESGKEPFIKYNHLHELPRLEILINYDICPEKQINECNQSHNNEATKT